MSLNSLATRLLGILKGEPLRAIVYGATVVIWLVAAISGRIPDISIDDAMVQATAAAGFLTEVCRLFVYSPATVERLTANTPTPLS